MGTWESAGRLRAPAPKPSGDLLRIVENYTEALTMARV